MRTMRRLLTIVLLGICAASAQGSVLLTRNGVWLHQHTRVYTYSIDPSVPSWWASAVVSAANEWSTRSQVLTLLRTTGSANIRVVAVNDDGPVGKANVPYHAPSWITLNTGRMTDSLINQLLGYPESVACHELGHALGLGHGGMGCMGTNRQDGDGGQAGLRLALDTRRPGADDVALLDATYPATGH